MSYISILRNGEGPSGQEENPIFIIESTPTEVIFEIFRSDAGVIQPLAGIPSRFAIDAHPFVGTITSLVPCEIAHEGLSLLQDSPTLRCTLEIAIEHEALG
jgi:hypothetical protein